MLCTTQVVPFHSMYSTNKHTFNLIIYIYKRTSSWKLYSASICKSSKNRGREMATMLSIALMLSAAFFMGCTNLAVANYGDASAGVIHVGGQVLCQNCFKSYKEWVNGSNPLKGINWHLLFFYTCTIQWCDLLFDIKGKWHFHLYSNLILSIWFLKLLISHFLHGDKIV